MKSITTHPRLAAFVGFLFASPFVIMNFIVALRLEPFYSYLGSFPAIRNAMFLPLLLLLLFPIGAYIASRPMLHKDATGRRKLFVINAIVAILLLVSFVVLFTALGEEMYRCEVLKIPNCD